MNLAVVQVLFRQIYCGEVSADSMDYYESYERKSDSLGWPEFIDMIDVLNNDPANAATVLNIDRVLWYFAVTTVLPNEDAYNTHVLHNYYMYQTGDGKWQMLSVGFE